VSRANGIYCGLMVLIAVILVTMFGVQSFRVTVRSFELERENEKLAEQQRELHEYAQQLEGLAAAGKRLADKLRADLEDCREWKQKLAGVEK
jgi:cell division protein FtsL